MGLYLIFALIDVLIVLAHPFVFILGCVCKLGLCHSERSEESRFSVNSAAKSEILRRSAPQKDMQSDFAYRL